MNVFIYIPPRLEYVLLAVKIASFCIKAAIVHFADRPNIRTSFQGVNIMFSWWTHLYDVENNGVREHPVQLDFFIQQYSLRVGTYLRWYAVIVDTSIHNELKLSDYALRVPASFHIAQEWSNRSF